VRDNRSVHRTFRQSVDAKLTVPSRSQRAGKHRSARQRGDRNRAREECGITIGWVKDDVAVLFTEYSEEWDIAAY
jgi:hypothetical protein